MVKSKKQSVQAKSILKKCAAKSTASQSSTGAPDHSPTGKSPFTGNTPDVESVAKSLGRTRRPCNAIDACLRSPGNVLIV